MTRLALARCAVAAFAAITCAPETLAQAKPPAAQPAAPAAQPDPTAAEFDKFRAVLEEDNPAELFEAKGKELWFAKRGPNNASLEKCDLGLGPGVVKGAYVRAPRYYPDVGKVMDAERRIVHCMVTLQGFKMEDLAKQPFSTETRTPDAVSLTTFVAGQSRNMKIAVPQSRPEERETYAIGREVFNYRAGPYDFACATCHGEDGKRIRTQPLPNLTKPAEAIRAYQGWPGYRMTGGVMHTLQWRMNDCFRQQRFPAPDYVSDTITALLAYMGVNANGQVYKGPGIKR
jgi:sulfur-oxidizing protein SoxA